MANLNETLKQQQETKPYWKRILALPGHTPLVDLSTGKVHLRSNFEAIMTANTNVFSGDFGLVSTKQPNGDRVEFGEKVFANFLRHANDESVVF